MIQEELQDRKNRPFHQVFHYAQKLDRLIEKDAREEGSGMTAKHQRARSFLAALQSRAHGSADYAVQCLQWMEKGGTRLLKHDVLSPLGYHDELMTDFDAMVLLDDLGISLRKAQKNLRASKRRAQRKEAAHQPAKDSKRKEEGNG